MVLVMVRSCKAPLTEEEESIAAFANSMISNDVISGRRRTLSIGLCLRSTSH